MPAFRPVRTSINTSADRVLGMATPAGETSGCIVSTNAGMTP